MDLPANHGHRRLQSQGLGVRGSCPLGRHIQMHGIWGLRGFKKKKTFFKQSPLSAVP
jgi:hypothetical protein